MRKITSANFCKPLHDFINCSTSMCPFESGNVERKGHNYKNLNILRKKSFFDKIKNIFFTVFEGLLFGEK